MDAPARITYSPVEYRQLAEDYRVELRSLFYPPCPPCSYDKVTSRMDGELVMWLFFDAAKTHWVAFHPDEATEEVAELFEL